MYESLRGKRLLILGAGSNETTLVKRAQSFGVYVIVTDYHEDWSLSPAKYLADEAWNISWSEIGTLEEKCRQSGVDGVTAGYSEFRVESLIGLCRRLGLPCYITEKQLEITRDKRLFKKTCRENGVPTVREYACVEDVDEFPVIVKPVDRAGSIGISIAGSKEALRRAYDYAMETSVSKNVIIERYMQNTKVDVYYGIEDGEITLLSCCDTVAAANNGFEKVCQSAWLYPMADLDAYLEKVDRQARRMIEAMQIRYGCIFFSGFITEEKEFAFFECGFRMEGAHQYGYTERRGPYNFLDLFLLHALTGSTRLLRHTPVNEKLKCAVINIHAGGGVIGTLEGQEKIAEMPECTLVLTDGQVGDFCASDRAILSKPVLMSFADEDPVRLKQAVERGYQTLRLLDENGDDMVFDRIDTKKLLSRWER